MKKDYSAPEWEKTSFRAAANIANDLSFGTEISSDESLTDDDGNNTIEE